MNRLANPAQGLYPISMLNTSPTCLTDRALLRLAGDDPHDFLQALVTQDVVGEAPLWAGLLNPQGKALYDFIIWPMGADILLDCEAAAAAQLLARLKLYKMRRALEISLENALAVHWSIEGAQGVADPREARLGRRWLAPPSTAAIGYHPHRLALGVVEGQAELGVEQSLWLECRAEAQQGVSFTKGCYIGQENTTRMHHRDKLRKMIAVVPVDEAPEAARIFYPQWGYAVVITRL
jgi:tRNA-modifying protein YgfZ